MYMIKIKNSQYRKFILEKALAMQEEVMPLIMKKLCTSGHNVFIENAAITLANANMKYIEELFDIFKEIRNPYARSEVSIVFGVKKGIEYTSLLLL